MYYQIVRHRKNVSDGEKQMNPHFVHFSSVAASDVIAVPQTLEECRYACAKA